MNFPVFAFPQFPMAELIARAHVAASRYAIPAEFVCGLAEEESGERNVPFDRREQWNPWAVKYEPGFLERYILKGSTATPTTEQITESMSYGVMQVMGATARELGFTGRWLTALCVPEVGFEFGCRKLRRCLDNAGGDVAKALSSYNGGSDTNYAGRVAARIGKYKTL